MMVARAPYNEVMAALDRAIDAEGLTTVMVSREEHTIDLHRGLNLYTYGDDIRVHVLDIDPVVVVHIQTRIAKGAPQIGTIGRYPWKYEMRFLEAVRQVLGADRAVVLE